MRFFKTTNSSRSYKTAGLEFSFEPVGQIGGSWFGVLALEKSSAGILAGAAFPQVTELTEEEYNDEKKKPQSRSSHSYDLQAQRPPAAPVSPPAPSAAAAPESPESQIPKHQSARVEPPDELSKTEPVRPVAKPVRKP